MNNLKAATINQSLHQEFQNELIRENSKRFAFILYMVIVSQLIFIPLELLSILPWQWDIFYSRVGVIGISVLFVGCIHALSKGNSGTNNLNALGYVLFTIQLITLLVGCYFVVNAFHQEIHSFSAFMLVSFIVSITNVRNPYYSFIGIAFFIGLSIYLHVNVVTISFWVSEFLIALVFLFVLYLGTILNYNRHIRLFMNDKEITCMNRKLMELSHVDALTSIYNRRRLAEAIDEHIQLYKRYQYSFCLAIIDIDLFKEVNDTYGHIIGDSVLMHFSSRIKAMLRSTDIFGRWGGEEFLLILPNCDEAEALTLVDRLRNDINAAELIPNIRITFSAGICAYQNHSSYSELVSQADQALYIAKNSGRNKAVIHTD